MPPALARLLAVPTVLALALAAPYVPGAAAAAEVPLGPWRAARPPAVAPPAADRIRADQWGLRAIHARQAWSRTQGAGVTVAVLDTGVDARHPDLTGAVRTGPDHTGSGGGTGSSSGSTAGRHGTAMASIIAGHGHGAGGANGIMGVAPKARVLDIRVAFDRGDPRAADLPAGQRGAVAKAVRYAADHGARVICLSLGGPDHRVRAGQEERAAIAYAASKGAVVVGPAGNDGPGRNRATRPAGLAAMITAGAFDREHEVAEFSTLRSYVTLTAPGVGVPAARPGGQYQVIDNTSAAAAHVAGVAALILARHPGLAPRQVREAISKGTLFRPDGRPEPGHGWGALDARKALTAAAGLTPASAGPEESVPSEPRAGAPAEPAEPAAGSGGAGLSRYAVPGAAVLLLIALVLLLLRRRGRRDRPRTRRRPLPTPAGAGLEPSAGRRAGSAGPPSGEPPEDFLTGAAPGRGTAGEPEDEDPPYRPRPDHRPARTTGQPQTDLPGDPATAEEPYFSRRLPADPGRSARAEEDLGDLLGPAPAAGVNGSGRSARPPGRRVAPNRPAGGSAEPADPLIDLGDDRPAGRHGSPPRRGPDGRPSSHPYPNRRPAGGARRPDDEPSRPRARRPPPDPVAETERFPAVEWPPYDLDRRSGGAPRSADDPTRPLGSRRPLSSWNPPQEDPRAGRSIAWDEPYPADQAEPAPADTERLPIIRPDPPSRGRHADPSGRQADQAGRRRPTPPPPPPSDAYDISGYDFPPGDGEDDDDRHL